MISILILDDNAEKTGEIKKRILEITDINNKDITCAQSTNDARRILDRNQFDLLIIDLLIPEDFGDSPKVENAISLLYEIQSSPNITAPYHIIGLTAYEKLQEKHKDSFYGQLWFLITYNQSEQIWSDLLKSKIDFLIGSKKEMLNPSYIKYNYDVAFVTALPKELEKVKAIDANWSLLNLKSDSTQYYVGFILNGKIKITLVAAHTPQMGSCASASLSMKMIHQFRPRYIIMTGIAAGIKGTGNFGDILVADQVWDGASGKIKQPQSAIKTFLPDPKYKILDEDLKDKILAIQTRRLYLDMIKTEWLATKPDASLNLHIGPLATMPAVIESVEQIEELKKQSRKVIGLEMEAYGVFYSAAHCSKPKPKAICIKSICDFADEEKSDDYQDYAAYTSAQFAYNLILNHLDFE